MVKVPLFRQKPYKIFGREIYIKGGVVCNTRDSIIWSSLCTGHEPSFWSGSTNTWDSTVYRFYDSKNMNNFRCLLLSIESALCLQFFRKIVELKNILSCWNWKENKHFSLHNTLWCWYKKKYHLVDFHYFNGRFL